MTNRRFDQSKHRNPSLSCLVGPCMPPEKVVGSPPCSTFERRRLCDFTLEFSQQQHVSTTTPLSVGPLAGILRLHRLENSGVGVCGHSSLKTLEISYG